MESVLTVYTMVEIYSDVEQRHYEDAETGTVLIFDQSEASDWPDEIVVTVIGVVP